MPKIYKWTNRSVLTFAGNADPVATMEGRALILLGYVAVPPEVVGFEVVHGGGQLSVVGCQAGW